MDISVGSKNSQVTGLADVDDSIKKNHMGSTGETNFVGKMDGVSGGLGLTLCGTST